MFNYYPEKCHNIYFDDFFDFVYFFALLCSKMKVIVDLFHPILYVEDLFLIKFPSPFNTSKCTPIYLLEIPLRHPR